MFNLYLPFKSDVIVDLLSALSIQQNVIRDEYEVERLLVSLVNCCIVILNKFLTLKFLFQWMQLCSRRTNLTRLFEKMKEYLYEQYSDPDKPSSLFRPITDEEIERYISVYLFWIILKENQYFHIFENLVYMLHHLFEHATFISFTDKIVLSYFLK